MTCGLQHEGAKKRAQIRIASQRKERGSSLVEQSFIIVFLLTLMLGIIDCGRALYTYHFVSNVAREATRWASVRSTTCNTTWVVPPGVGASSCPVAGANKIGCMVHIDVTYHYTFLFVPFISAPPIT